MRRSASGFLSPAISGGGAATVSCSFGSPLFWSSLYRLRVVGESILKEPGIVSSILEDHLGTIWVTRVSKTAGGALCQVSGSKTQCHRQNRELSDLPSPLVPFLVVIERQAAAAFGCAARHYLCEV